jgi:hypothetical protein
MSMFIVIIMFVDFAGLEDDDYVPVAEIGTLLLIYSEYVLLHRFSARTVPEDDIKSANDERICKDRQTVDATGCCDRQDPVLVEGKVSIPFNLLGLVSAQMVSSDCADSSAGELEYRTLQLLKFNALCGDDWLPVH